MRAKSKKTQIKPIFIFLSLVILLLIGLLSIYKTVTINSRADESGTVTTGQELSAQFYRNIESSLTVENSQDLNPELGFTMEAWFKVDGIVHNEHGGYIFNKEHTGGSPVLQLYLTMDNADNDQALMTYEMRIADTRHNCSTRTIMNQITLPVEEALRWHHVAGVIQDNGDLDLFVDGERSTINTNHVNVICQNSDPVTIAHSLYGGGFEGYLDDVRMSNIARYTSNFTPPLREGGYTADQYDKFLYDFNETNDGQTVLDSSGTGHNGLIQGTVKFNNVQ